jgi:hypothetical protein
MHTVWEFTGRLVVAKPAWPAPEDPTHGASPPNAVITSETVQSCDLRFIEAEIFIDDEFCQVGTA